MQPIVIRWRRLFLQVATGDGYEGICRYAALLCQGSGLRDSVWLQSLLCAGADRHPQGHSRARRPEPAPGAPCQCAGGYTGARPAARGHDKDAHGAGCHAGERLAHHPGGGIGAAGRAARAGEQVARQSQPLHKADHAGAGGAHRRRPARRRPHSRPGCARVAAAGRAGRCRDRREDCGHQRSEESGESGPAVAAQQGAGDHHQAGPAGGMGLPLCVSAVFAGGQCQPAGHHPAGGAHFAPAACCHDRR